MYAYYSGLYRVLPTFANTWDRKTNENNKMLAIILLLNVVVQLNKNIIS